jgi:hypothetical protein
LNIRKLYFNVIQLANKYPNFISAKSNKIQNEAYLDLLHQMAEEAENDEDTIFDFVLSERNRFLSNKELVMDCENIGISLDFIFEDTGEFPDWFLYDGIKIRIYPSGGEDYLGARVLGVGAQKVVYQSKGDVLKKLEDIPTLEIFISNKYPELFATYTLAGNLAKQEKLRIYDEEDIEEEFTKEFNLLISNIKRVLKFENINLELDIHSENVGYDSNNKLKCFDFISPYNIPRPLDLSDFVDKINVSELKEYNINNLRHEYYTVKHNNKVTNIIGINIINETRCEMYINYMYKMLLPYLKDILIIFAMEESRFFLI